MIEIKIEESTMVCKSVHREMYLWGGLCHLGEFFYVNYLLSGLLKCGTAIYPVNCLYDIKYSLYSLLT